MVFQLQCACARLRSFWAILPASLPSTLPGLRSSTVEGTLEIYFFTYIVLCICQALF